MESRWSIKAHPETIRNGHPEHKSQNIRLADWNKLHVLVLQQKKRLCTDIKPL